MKPSYRRLFRRGLVYAAAFLSMTVPARTGGATQRSESPFDLLDQMARVLVLVENEYVDPVERERLVRGAIKGMVAELDPHSSYLPAEEFAVFQEDTEGRFGGIGVEVDFSGEFVTVIAPIDGSPAQRSGILPGDRIVAIDGAPVQRKSPEWLVRQMRGAPGTRVTLSVRRPGQDELLYFSMTREIIHVASVQGKLLKGHVAYLRIKQFQAGTHTEFLRYVGQLKRQSAEPLQGVILDLRNNPGGLVDEAVAVADEFLVRGVVFTMRHRGKIVEETGATPDGALRTGPMVVLVNEYSASAAELLAGALQDQHRAIVVGAQTFGKGSVQTIIGLPNNDGLRLTTMRYYTPAGHAIQANGITPDVKVDAAYVKDTSFGVVRESDLEGHLEAEGRPKPPRTPEPTGGSEVNQGQDGTKSTYLGVAREVPDNPVGGDDLALSIGYQIVSGVLQRMR
jgi:carboxyl-terminal processing protease